jgi:hypothetical protein
MNTKQQIMEDCLMWKSTECAFENPTKSNAVYNKNCAGNAVKFCEVYTELKMKHSRYNGTRGIIQKLNDYLTLENQ